MTFPTLQGRSDPRVLCGILANQFLRDFDSATASKPDDAGTVCLVNLMRLLDLYRLEVMTSVPEPAGILQREPLKTTDWSELAEDPFMDLEKAMQSAQNAVFGQGLTRDEVAVKLSNVLRQRLAGKEPNTDAVQKTQQFFQELLKQLKR